MPKPGKDNEYVKMALNTWRVDGYTFCLIDSHGEPGYLVRVFHDGDDESHWLEGGPWETESGCAWSILNYLDDWS